VTLRKTGEEKATGSEKGESSKGQAISHRTTATTQQQVDKALRIRRVCGGQPFPSCCTLSSSLSSYSLLAMPLRSIAL